ncbi:MAG: hypothetical protein PUB10_07890 [Clostridiales bacterium]|nr:hypothetical protein [Clostridiales bacterium]
MKTVYIMGTSAVAFSAFFSEGISRLGYKVLLLDDSASQVLLQTIRREPFDIPVEDYQGVDVGKGEELIPEEYDYIIYYSDSQENIGERKIDVLYLVSGCSKYEMEQIFQIQQQYEGSWVLLKGIPQEKKSLSYYTRYFYLTEENERQVRIIWFDYLDYRTEGEFGFDSLCTLSNLSDSYLLLLTDWISRLTGKTTREVHRMIKKKRGWKK